ncbi:MAG: c-type cytochrome [Ginsengibacter sp.]
MKKGYCILIISLFLLLLSTFIACNRAKKSGEEWTAPDEADDLKSPFQNNSLAEQKGKEVYNLYCLSCHGESGFGDGAAGASFERRPANFHDRRVREQSNGSLFWKITNGRVNMPPFKQVLSEEQRWQLVSYIRRISTMQPPLRTPTALQPDIKVEHVMNVDSVAVRILQNPVTGNLWYTTFNGNVFEIKNLNSKHPESEKIFSAGDHGITRLQGAAFLNNTLFLCGNIDSNSHTSTKGRMICYNLDSISMHPAVVFNTVEYGANKTIYDHGWNALEVSHDGKYIYVNSGARTDHGEVQDNGGLYPNARDNSLTSKIFRFPVDARNLYLTDDAAKLKAEGYLYAEGIRNAYDMAFDGDGHLFAVSNSPDYDMSEDMFWVREHHHYGFPWVIGGIENPQQYPDWQPDPETDPFIPKFSHSWRVRYFHNDPTFPKIPVGVKFSPGVQNLGPDANEYRGHSGKILDGDQTGVTVSTFTAHCCPIGLCFDTKKMLSKDFKGDGFVIRYSLGARSSMMRPFTYQGADLLHLRMTFDTATNNYFVRTNRIVEGFNEPTDAVLVGSDIYVITYGGKGGNIWKITLPADIKQAPKMPEKN